MHAKATLSNPVPLNVDFFYWIIESNRYKPLTVFFFPEFILITPILLSISLTDSSEVFHDL